MLSLIAPLAAARRRKRLALCLLALSVMLTANAFAQQCSIDMPDVAFGSIDQLSPTPHDASVDVQIECMAAPSTTTPVGVCIYFDAGSGGVANGTRNMTLGAGSLPFNLYKDAARSQIWGSETTFPASGAQRVVVALPGTPPNRGTLAVPVYARIPASNVVATAPPGTYTSSFNRQARITFSFNTNMVCDGSSSGGRRRATSFMVDATVVPTCTVEADDLDFGIAGALDVDVEADSQVRTACTNGTVYSVALNAGTASGATVNSRRMTHTAASGQTTGYQLYRDAARSQIWGMDPGQVNSGTGDGTPTAWTVHGRVPAQTTPISGIYRDTIVVTVTY